MLNTIFPATFASLMMPIKPFSIVASICLLYVGSSKEKAEWIEIAVVSLLISCLFHSLPKRADKRNRKKENHHLFHTKERLSPWTALGEANRTTTRKEKNLYRQMSIEEENKQLTSHSKRTFLSFCSIGSRDEVAT